MLGSANCYLFFYNLETNLNLFVVKNNTTSYPIVLGRNFIDGIGMVLQRPEKEADCHEKSTLPESSSSSKCNRFSSISLSSERSCPNLHECMQDLSLPNCQCHRPQVSTSKEEINFVEQKERPSLQVFFNILDLAGINTWILYKQTTGENISRQDFLLKLAEELSSDFREARKQPKQGTN